MTYLFFKKFFYNLLEINTVLAVIFWWSCEQESNLCHVTHYICSSQVFSKVLILHLKLSVIIYIYIYGLSPEKNHGYMMAESLGNNKAELTERTYIRGWMKYKQDFWFKMLTGLHSCSEERLLRMWRVGRTINQACWIPHDCTEHMSWMEVNILIGPHSIFKLPACEHIKQAEILWRLMAQFRVQTLRPGIRISWKAMKGWKTKPMVITHRRALNGKT